MYRVRLSIVAIAVVTVALVLAADRGSTRLIPARAHAAGDPAAGAKVFADNGCTVCHTFTPAKASGTIGPNLDRTKLDAAAAAAVITGGRGVMPSFKGKLSASQIADVAAYVTGATATPASPQPRPKPKPTPKPSTGGATGPALAVRLTDTQLLLARKTLAPGAVTVLVRNAGHAASGLLLARVTPSVRLVASFRDVKPGASARRTVQLVAGSYLLTASRGGVTGSRMLAMLTVRTATRAGTPGGPTPTPTPTPGAPGPGADAPGRAGDATNGARLFAALGCGGCHTFAPAGAKGTVGPNLGQTKPSAVRIATILNLGSGPMPSFASRVTQQEIADIVAYITSANASGAAGGAGGTTPGGTTGTTGGAQIFAEMGCGGCHTLAAAGARGAVGPNLDTLRPSQNQVVAMVTAGGGVMPAFGGRLTTSQILEVAAYVSSVAGTGATGGGGTTGGGTSGGGTTTGPIGLVLFQRGGCGACHTLAAAGTTGTVGPSLDDKRPDREKVVEILTEGKDRMPSFATVFSSSEMQELGSWIEASTGR